MSRQIFKIGPAELRTQGGDTIRLTNCSIVQEDQYTDLVSTHGVIDRVNIGADYTVEDNGEPVAKLYPDGKGIVFTIDDWPDDEKFGYDVNDFARGLDTKA